MATLRELRLGRLLTQEELAQELGITSGAISQLERGVIKPRLRVLRRICQFFEIQPSEFDIPEPAKSKTAA